MRRLKRKHCAVLRLFLKREWYDLIASGEKREREELDKRISDLEAYAKLWTDRADELRLKCDEFYAKTKPFGNAAAWEETCAKCRDGIEPRHCEYYGEPNGCNSPTYGEHPPVGNEAVMREALKNSNGLLEELAAIGEWGESAREQISENNGAISAPPRQCDVGTAEEQNVRWRGNCGRGIPNCWHCKVYAHAKESGLVSDRGLMRCDCKFIWAQMPYESEAKE